VLRLLSFLVVALCFAAPVHAQGANRSKAKETEEQRQLQRLRELTKELRDLPSKSPGKIARATDQKRIFAEIVKINHTQAVRFLIVCADDPTYAQLREELLRMLTVAPGADETLVAGLMRTHMAPDDPARRIARDYLLSLAKRRRKEDWLDGLFTGGTIEDRFLALQVMGEIRSAAVVDCAVALQKDKGWRPDESGVVSCGTIALSLRDAEGEPAARLLLVLMKDPRFTPADAQRVREATRLWRQSDLRTYIRLADLADGDPRVRLETAAFLGTVGLEAARAPLVRVAFNRREAPDVRAAAATALGGLRIAKEDLAANLGVLLSDPEPLVRRGAQDGLGRLMVRPAVEAFVSMLDGPFGEEVRAALARLTDLPANTDWKKWLPETFQERTPRRK
jgi:HEAT repeat protein